MLQGRYILSTLVVFSYLATLATGPAAGQRVSSGERGDFDAGSRLASQIKSDAQRPVALLHVTVIDVAVKDSNRALKPDQTVVITGDRIASVGRTGRVHTTANAQEVNAAGKYVIPGLWDMHVHSLYPQRPDYFLALFIANGVTGVREMGSVFSLEDIRRVRQDIQEGKLLGPRYGAVCGHIFEGPVPPNRLGPEFVSIATPNEVPPMIRSYRQQGADFIKVYNLLSRDVYFAIAEETRKQKLPFAGHLPFSISAVEASDAGQRSLEHLQGIPLSCSTEEENLRKSLLKVIASASSVPNREAIDVDTASIDTYDAQKAAALFQRFARNGTWQCPTLTLLEAYCFGADTRFSSSPRLKYVPPSVRKGWSNSPAFQKASAEDYARRKKLFTKELGILVAMQRQGVGILAGTDAAWGNPYTFPGFRLHDELALFVQAGLTPLEALQTATLNPASFLHIEDTLGTVEQGKIADLLLLEANPLNDILNTQRIAAVVVNGRYLSVADLQKILSGVEALASKP